MPTLSGSTCQGLHWISRRSPRIYWILYNS